MDKMPLILSASLVVISIVLILIVLLQPAKPQGGGSTNAKSETFYGKGKKGTILGKLTGLVATLFIVVALAMFLLPKA